LSNIKIINITADVSTNSGNILMHMTNGIQKHTEHHFTIFQVTHFL